jgi:hypothetical protein
MCGFALLDILNDDSSRNNIDANRFPLAK